MSKPQQPRPTSAPRPTPSATHGPTDGATSRDPVVHLRPLGFPWKTEDPFLFSVHHLDHYPAGDGNMAPTVPLTGRHIGSDFSGRDGWSMYHGRTVPGFPQHPHRGFETISVMRRGYIDHADSMGATARIGPGDVQWMTAGKGIVHAEMFPLLDPKGPNPLELFQIWINLPARDKMVSPHFTMLWREQIPVRTFHDAAGHPTQVTVIAGALGDTKAPTPPPKSWASRPQSDVAIFSIRLGPGATWTLPAGPKGVNRNLYHFTDVPLSVANRSVPSKTAIKVHADQPVTLTAGAKGCDVLMLQGRPIGERVVQHGPFVMNTQAEIRQAFADYRRTHFGRWPWPSEDPVHARDAGRFARHADGRVERKQRG